MLRIKWKFGKNKVADKQRTGNTKQETRSEESKRQQKNAITKKQEKKKRK